MRTGQVRAAYLGDGVFLQFEPGRLVLTTDTDRIVLNPDVWEQLLRLVRQYDDKAWPFTAGDVP